MILAALLLASTCSAEDGRAAIRFPCRVVADDDATVVIARGGAVLPWRAETITVERIGRRQASFRILTKGGINARSDDVLLEDGGSCWSSGARRLCTTPSPPRRRTALPAIPADLRGRWQPGDDDFCEEGPPEVRLGSATVGEDGSAHAVLSVGESSGIVTVAFRSDGGRGPVRTWRIARDGPDRIARQGDADVLHRCPPAPSPVDPS